MGDLRRFRDFHCPVCKTFLCSLHYKNTGMVGCWCWRCKKAYIVHKLELKGYKEEK